MTELETDILRWISTRTDSAALHRQLEGAEVVKRDYIRTGYFIYLRASDSSPAIDKDVTLAHPAIIGPQLPDGAGSNLFLKDGYLHYLEIYSRGGFFPETLSDYQLVDDE